MFEKNKVRLIFLLVTVVNLAACNNGGGSVLRQDASYNGRLMDNSYTPVSAALIRVNSENIETHTDKDGYFSLHLEAGAHQLVMISEGIIFNTLCVTAAEGVRYNLGDINPNSPSNCPVGTPVAGDADADGLQDSDEIAGWNINITLGDGTVESRKVNSDPALYDTDADGLSDAEEMAARTDPRSIDTDADLLSDHAELNIYKSHPTRVDSDGDSCDPDSEEGECISNPNMWDGYELALSKTSPTLADTDGDGLGDYQEINTGGTHPLIADLPDLSLELNGDPSIILNITLKSTSTKDTVSSSLRSDTEEQKKNSKASTDLTRTHTTAIHAEVEVGTGKWPPSASVKTTHDTNITSSYAFHTDTSFSKDSVQATKDTYDAKVSDENAVDFDDGMLWVAIKLKNRSSLAFKLKDLKVIAYRMELGGSFSTVGTLVPGYKSVDGDLDIWVKEPLCADPSDSANCGQVLGPSDELTLVVGADALPAQIMRALVKNPTALRFEVASYSLFQLDEFGVNETINYAKLGESVVQRCGLLSVDYGDGNVLNKMIATNVYRNPDGSGRGITLSEALSTVLNLDYETVREADSENDPGKEVLYRVKSTRAYDKCDSTSTDYDETEDCDNLNKMGLWMVGGSDQQFDDNTPQIDFNDLLLKNDEQINLIYLQDSDGEGVFDREEYLLGTDKSVPDTDGDSLNDYDETRTGWVVAVDNMKPYQVFPDPRFQDIDGDFLSDSTESFIGTDPYKLNTDGDELADTIDPFPLSPPCLAGSNLSMTAWWDGSSENNTPQSTVALDIWTGVDPSTNEDRGIASNGIMYDSLTPSNLVSSLNNEAVFRFNSNPDQNTQFIDVTNQENDGLSPNRELTFSTMIYWNGVATGKEWGSVFTKGNPDTATYGLFINADGRLKFSLYRNSHVQCWVKLPISGAWIDEFCEDFNHNDSEVLETGDNIIPKQQWVTVTATFRGETMSLYLNDNPNPIATRVTDTGYRYDGEYRYQDRYTRNLVANNEPLRIGGEFNGSDTYPEEPFRGFLDDIQIFGRGLNDDEVSQMNKIGICKP